MQRSLQLQEIHADDIQLAIDNNNVEEHENDQNESNSEKFQNIPPQYGPRGYQQSNEYQPMPKKIIIICTFLFVAGTGFLIAGFVDYFLESGQKWRGIMFFVIGSLLFIPGIYYSYFLFEAYRATSPEERRQILDEIPVEQDY